MLSWSGQNLPCTLYTVKTNCADLRFQILHSYVENMSVTKKIQKYFFMTKYFMLKTCVLLKKKKKTNKKRRRIDGGFFTL